MKKSDKCVRVSRRPKKLNRFSFYPKWFFKTGIVTFGEQGLYKMVINRVLNGYWHVSNHSATFQTALDGTLTQRSRATVQKINYSPNNTTAIKFIKY